MPKTKGSKHILATSLLILTTLILIHKTTIATNANSLTTTIYVDPQTTIAAVGQGFAVNVNVSNVVDLYGWELKLRWNTTLLDTVNVVEGPFLKSRGSTFFTYNANNTVGSVLVDCTFLGLVPGVSGNGTLATIEFYVETVGECSLDLYNTTLVNSFEWLIPHDVIDGYFYASAHDVAVINLAASDSMVTVTVKNQGAQAETFNVSAYYTLLIDPLIGTQTVTLESGANTTLTFPWKPPSDGRYEIRAEASVVPDEVDVSDNNHMIYFYVIFGGKGFECAPQYL